MKARAYQVELSRADYAVGLGALVRELANLDDVRGRLLIGRLAVMVVTLALIAFLFPHSLPGLLTAALMIWLGDWLVRSAFATQSLGVSFDPEAHSNMRVEFSESGIAEESALRSRRWTWDAVRRLHLSPGHVVVELKGWDMIILPDRLWASPEERKMFVAELEARRLPGEMRTAIPSEREATAGVVLIEPVLLARIALSVAAYQLVFEGRVRAGTSLDPNGLYVTTALALVAAGLLWWISGAAFRALARRSVLAALRIARILLLLLTAVFVLWILGRL